MGYPSQKKATAPTKCVEVGVENGVRLLVSFYFAAFLTLVVLSGRGCF